MGCSDGWALLRKFPVLRERPLDSQGGAWVFFEKNILALVLAKKIFWPWPCVKKISWLHPLKKNVCPLSMKRKCLPSIHEKKMSALYIHENKMLALYK